MQISAARVGVALLIAVGVLGAAAIGVVILLEALFVFKVMSHPGAPVAERIRAAARPSCSRSATTPRCSAPPSCRLAHRDADRRCDRGTGARPVVHRDVPAGGDQIPPDILRVEQGDDVARRHTGGHTVLPRPTILDDDLVYVHPTCPAAAGQAVALKREVGLLRGANPISDRVRRPGAACRRRRDGAEHDPLRAQPPHR